MREGVRRSGALLLVLVAFCLPLFIGLGDADLGNDEAIYAYAAESILRTGEWMSPRSSPFDNVVFLEKPSLKFWIVAAPIRIGLLPRNEFGLRFWDAVFGSSAFLYVLLIGRRQHGAVCGVAAVLVLFVHEPLLFEHGLRSNNMEAALLLAYCGGIYHFLRWGDAEAARERSLHIAAVVMWFFLGFMTKFVAAIFLPGILLLTAIAVPSYRRHALQDWRRWLLAGVAFVALASPWFIYQHLHHGRQFWRIILGEHVFQRFTASLDPAHVHPWHYYVSDMATQLGRSMSGWWVLAGILVMIGAAVRHRQRAIVPIVLWWAVPTLLISLGTSKLYHYYYPFLPPVALAAGFGASVLWDWFKGLGDRTPFLTRIDRRWQLPRVVRVIVVVALLISAVAVAIAMVSGPVRFEILPGVRVRNSSLLRPLIVATLSLIVLGRIKLLVGAAAVLLFACYVPSPLHAYLPTVSHLERGRQPMKLLSGCIGRVDKRRRARGETPPPIYSAMPQGTFSHPPFYYFGGTPGWHSPREGLLREALYGPDLRPVLTSQQDLDAFFAAHPDLSAPMTVNIDPFLVVALPGPYEFCAAAVRQSHP